MVVQHTCLLCWQCLAGLSTSQPQAADLAQLQAVPSDKAMSDVLQQLSVQYNEVRLLPLCLV